MAHSRAARLVPGCPICVEWTCDDCGHVKHQVDGRNFQRCPKCSCTSGTTIPIMHYRRDVHDSHVIRFNRERTIWPMDRERQLDVMALIDFLTPHMHIYRRMLRRSFRFRSGTPEQNSSVNITNEELRKIEDIVR